MHPDWILGFGLGLALPAGAGLLYARTLGQQAEEHPPENTDPAWREDDQAP